MPSNDVTLVTARRGFKADGDDSLGWRYCASVSVQGADDPIDPAQLFSRECAYWNVLSTVLLLHILSGRIAVVDCRVEQGPDNA